MPKINVYLPDELAEAVRKAGVPVSAVCQRALEQAVRRVTAIRETALGSADADLLTARLTHFTPRTREVVKLAVEQARNEGVTEVGTEHLLGGMLTEGGNLALQVLGALEIEPAEIRRRLDRPAADSPAASGACGAELTFGATAAAALELTVTEATALGHNYVGCEHLLLGLIAEPDGAAGHILRGLGAEQRLTRRAVVAALAGYVHLRAQTQAAPAPAAPPVAPPAAVANALSEAVRQELRPILRRLERLEERLDAAEGSAGS
ncbi:ATP-dependent Clp protease ATP-binding subunit ClpC [Streptosporangium becharense]|uniref:ATP-dependent Clp protease ATP-binding subunit ClpC n=1 Tax=Streptosporangium becharense TaxID=1816182 RepID=A0A7W9IL88_9ACTN|nr:Clp protease N-terminal domain-containing protein [Streptosporangium becharense]MBB2911816.1 ATP-dependent Clp protease ATP-binding subunit ClpC [Streptosporangium becharense]MBB5822366.1 ATP-dependent Clp protease ATP-binding subunit ClpC [Streptosporangium becharense]